MACIAPLNKRTTINIHNAVARPVTMKLSASPEKPSSSTGRRPYLSDSAPSTGEAKKLATPNDNATAPNQKVCSVVELVNVPTSGGSTGTISPMAIMSISTVSRMKIMAGWRRPGAASDELIPCGSWALPW